MSFLEYLYNALFVTPEHTYQCIAFVPAATLALGGIQMAKSFLDKPEKPGEVEPYDPAKDKALQERKQRLKFAQAQGTGVDQRMRNLSAASTAQGIEAAMEAGKSANYLSDINKFVEQQRQSDIALGLEAAQRQERRKEDYLAALKDESSAIQSAKQAEANLAMQEQQAYLADKAARQQDLFGGAQMALTGLDMGGIGTTDAYGRRGAKYKDMSRSEWKAAGGRNLG